MIRVALTAAALLLCGAASAQEFGRLFMTPEQRAVLDVRRSARIPDRPAPVATVSPTTRFDGHVQRAGGRSTVWLNGVPVPEGSQPDGYRVTTRPGEPGRASVSAVESERIARMKVGESLDTGTGEVRPSHGEGRIEVGPARPARK